MFAYMLEHPFTVEVIRILAEFGWPAIIVGGQQALAQEKYSLPRSIYIAHERFDSQSLASDCDLTNSTIVDNHAVTCGGGIAHWNTNGNHQLSIGNSTISGNTGSRGGGMLVDVDAYYGGSLNLRMTNSTITANTASVSGGGIQLNKRFDYYSSALGEIHNTIIAGNLKSNGTANDVQGSAGFESSSSHNLLRSGFSGGLANNVNHNVVLSAGASVGLGGLADNGGPPRTHALISGPAIDGGDNDYEDGTIGSVILYDQRQGGFDRIKNGGTSMTAVIGAFEYTNAGSGAALANGAYLEAVYPRRDLYEASFARKNDDGSVLYSDVDGCFAELGNDDLGQLLHAF